MHSNSLGNMSSIDYLVAIFVVTDETFVIKIKILHTYAPMYCVYAYK